MKKLAKILCLVLALALCLCMFAACGDKEEKKADTKTDETPKTFTVGFDAEFPPYGYMDDNGDYVGFDLDLAAEVAERNGWEIVLKPIDWNSKDMELDSGSIDCIWNGFTMNGREDLYTWTVAYVDNSQVFVVPENSGIATIADLADKSVAVQDASSAQAALEDKPEIADTFKELLPVPDYNTAFMNLESGAVNAVAMDIGVAQYNIDQRGGGFVILDEQLASEQYGVGFKLGNTELRDTVQETLYAMLDDGTFAEIAEEWGLSSSVCLSK